MFSLRAKYLVLASAAALAACSGTLAQVSSSAFCRVTSISRGAAVNQDAYTNAWLDIGNYVCGAQADEPTVVNIDEQVEQVAFAIAEAFAEVSASCHARANAEVRARAYELAFGRAEVLGRVLEDIIANGGGCGGCGAAVDALVAQTRLLLAEAVAEAWTELYLFSDTGLEAANITAITSPVIVDTIATVLTAFTSVIRTGADDGCSIEVINSAQVRDFVRQCEITQEDPNFRIVDVDAIAKAGVEAAEYACSGDIAEANVVVIAAATARALAEAVVQLDVFCKQIIPGGDAGRACGLELVDVRAIATVQAEAFAAAFATAETCGCVVSATANASLWEDIWAESVINAYAETCAVVNVDDFVADFEFAVAERMLSATARAIASTVAAAPEDPHQDCRFVGGPCSVFIPGQCANNNRQCGGRGFDSPLPCCDPDSHCVVRNENSFICRARNQRIPSFFDGRIANCHFIFTPLPSDGGSG